MKTRITLLIICLCLAVGVRAQFQIVGGTQHVLCDITMKDSTTYKGYEIELPHSWDKKIKIKKDKEKLTLKSDDVDFFYAWHEKAPDTKYLFKYTGYWDASPTKCNLRNGKKDKYWKVRHTEGPFMEYWFSCPKYRISKNFKITGYGGTEISNYLWIKGEQYPNYVAWPERVTGKFYRGALMNIVKADPALYKEIEESGFRKGAYGYMKEHGFDELVMKYMPAPEVPKF